MRKISGNAYESIRNKYRLYLNPPRALIPDLVDNLLEQTKDISEPFHFKFIDPLDPHVSEHDRFDQMVVYLSNDESVDLVLTALDRVAAIFPKGFQGRKPPPLTLPIREGVGFAQEPNDPNHNDELHRGYRMHRQRFLEDAYRSVYQDGMANEELLRHINERAEKTAPSWNINPQNLALNLHD